MKEPLIYIFYHNIKLFTRWNDACNLIDTFALNCQALILFILYRQKNYNYKNWLILPQAFQSKLSIHIFGLCALSTLSFLLFSEICGLITVSHFISIFPILSFYLIFVIFLSRWLSDKMVSPLKIVEKNIEEMLITFDPILQPKLSSISEYNFLQTLLVNNLQLRNEKEKMNKQFNYIATCVAHDLNNPINGIQMIMPKIKNKISMASEIKLLETYINQIQLIASDILNYFRLNTSEKIEINNINLSKFIMLEDILNDIIKNNKQWDCNIYFLNNSISWVNVVYIKLQRVLTNLLNNAYESLKSSNRNIIIKITSKDCNHTLIIEDTGCGIPKEYLYDILQGKSLKHKGKGLGLSTSLEYFKKINGNLVIESKYNVGTKIIITIPQSVPSWFTNKIQYTNNTIFIILEDNLANISALLKLFIDIDNEKLYFTEMESLKKAINNISSAKNIVLLVNYKYYESISEAIFSNINYMSIIYLINHESDQFENEYKIKNNHYKLIPSSLIKKITLEYKI